MKDPEVSYAGEQEPDEEDSEPDTFEGLTLDEGLLITSSSENIGRLSIHGDRKEEYRKIVERLMKNTGILCKNDMDKNQRHHLKRKVISDFRRQVVTRPHRYNAGGTLDER